MAANDDRCNMKAKRGRMVFIQTGYDKIGASGEDKNTRLVLILFINDALDMYILKMGNG